MTYRRKHASRICVTAALIVGALLSPAAAQDIRGVEKCTAEAQMERRTGCLQANVEFLHQALDKQRRDLQGKLDAAGRDAATQKIEIATLKAALVKLEHELAELRKAKPDNKTDKK